MEPIQSIAAEHFRPDTIRTAQALVFLIFGAAFLVEMIRDLFSRWRAGWRREPEGITRLEPPVRPARPCPVADIADIAAQAQKKLKAKEAV